MSHRLPLSRRTLLRSAAALGLGRATPLALSLAGIGSVAQAADTSGYKALVCVYLHGGSDMHNWLVPTDAAHAAGYAAARRELAWPATRLQAIAHTRQAQGRSFAMPTELGPLAQRYGARQLAWLANVGPLVRPFTKTDFQRGVGLPPKLFSHNDQTSAWQSMQPEGAPTGWGGRMADLLMAANSRPVFTSISATGNAVFLAGNQALQYQVSGSGPVAVEGLKPGRWTLGSTQLAATLQRTLTAPGSDAFSGEYAAVMRRSIDTAAALQAALAQVSVPALPTEPLTLGASGAINLSTDGLARQLRLVAQLARAGQLMGMSRQVFMVSMGGFDTHSNQMRDQPGQMARVALSIDHFLRSVEGLGLGPNVTLFTASEFGRTLTSNGDGSDHGWGSHHLVAGGAVRGGDIYGSFPVAAVGSADEVGSGRLLPSTSVTQLASSLAGWMGLSPAEQAYALPNLNAFSTTPLGFL